MPGINKVMLAGHLGKDPELRFIEANVAVVSFPLLTSEHFAKNGVSAGHTEWHNIILWRTVAENAAKILCKGKLVYVEGKLRTRSFEDQAGVKKYITEIIAENFKLIGRAPDFKGEPYK